MGVEGPPPSQILFTMNPNTRIADLTIGEFQELIRETMSVAISGPATVRGIKGLADLLGVSESAAKRIKASGILDRAISQRGSIIITDARLALELFSRSAHARRS